MPHAQQVLVVGAGPTGLVLALTLARSGVLPRIIDRRPGIAAESRALDVQARTLELYRQLGVAERVVAHGVPVRRVQVRAGGRFVSRTDVQDFGEGLSPYPFILCCPQDDHERLLVAELAGAGVEVEWQTELVALQETSDGVAVTLVRPDGSTEVSTVGYVGGCDGARSAVREQLGVAFDGGTSEQQYFVADVAATGDAASPSDQGAFSFCLDADDFMLVVPARRNGSHRVIGLVPDALGDQETVTFEDLSETLEATTGLDVDALNWFSTYRVSHRVADRFRLGRSFLLGDAGHLHSPLGGQGMNTGIADAVNLGWKLAAVLQGRAGARLLSTYEPERIRFARTLVRTTDRLFRLVDGPGGRHRLARGLLFRTLLPVLLRIPLSRQGLCRRIAQIGVSYRGSGLGRGAAGTVRGGDRLPWVQLGAGDDNFRSLATLDWQVHVYGTAHADLRAAVERHGLVLHVFPWTAAAEAAGLGRDASYLLRPDGYVALADPRQDVGALQDLLDAFGIRSRR